VIQLRCMIVRDLHYSQKGEEQIPVLRCPVHGC